MSKIKNKGRKRDIDLHIKQIFEDIIDPFLPRNYTAQVQEIVPEASKSNIRSVRNYRFGNSRIISALKTVAENNKQQLS